MHAWFHGIRELQHLAQDGDIKGQIDNIVNTFQWGLAKLIRILPYPLKQAAIQAHRNCESTVEDLQELMRGVDNEVQAAKLSCNLLKLNSILLDGGMASTYSD